MFILENVMQQKIIEKNQKVEKNEKCDKCFIIVSNHIYGSLIIYCSVVQLNKKKSVFDIIKIVD